ncbi:dipeptide/oligopeptide/nickel ABC transporter permease/ATP-binding protein [Embleya scabrispora]|uniref:dipeptide/oligopeptide/nickel ABC transporter permease/ATP-binding protein n=1 Tax=Embleya scabrispora TaxID=159449 RepID=UPI0003690E44|nr:dipeptide/oligopeptide/nickel ABC transporter permease/ATP-binding protein [Embleya scabrispora]MYS87667.1 ATP-binding cassette domain-containing protein [Streptomyces sp. SID5474]
MKALRAPGAPTRTVLRALVRDRNGLIGGTLVAILVGAVPLSLVWTPYDPTAVDPNAPWLLPFRGGHLLGTDMLGRDQFSLILVGSRETLLIALASAGIAAALGLPLALAAALGPRRFAAGVVQLIDVAIAFPALLTAMILAAVFGGSVWTAAGAIGVAFGVHLARIARAEIERVHGSDYVLAATASGSSTWRTVRRHILPNIAPTLLVQLSLVMAVASLTEAALSYLGYGSPAPAVSWGRILHDQQPYISARPLLVVWPGLAVALSVLGFNLLGDALRDATDPRLRRRAPEAPTDTVDVERTDEVGTSRASLPAHAALLRVTDLTIRIAGRTVVDGIDLTLAPGERLGLIGESGSGKSLTALAVLGLLPEGAEVTGSIRLDGVELLGKPERELARVRGSRVAMVFQEPLTALDPTMRIGRQIAEPLRLHRGMTGRQSDRAAIDLAARVGLPDPAELVRAWPHQLSGGQRQRVGIAIALACRPALLIADEPTTALDVTVQRDILALLDELAHEQGTALLFITHDLAVVSRVSDRIAVMRTGRVIEQGPLERILHDADADYTRALLAAARATAFDATAFDDAFGAGDPTPGVHTSTETVEAPL